MNPKLSAALSYLQRGMKLVPIEAKSKRPFGTRWNKSENLISTEARARAFWGDPPDGVQPSHEWNIGVHLATSKLASFDVDDYQRTQVALSALGIDVNDMLDAGWRIESGKPNKGRAMFAAPESLTFKSLRVPRERSEWRSYERNGRTFNAPTFINIFELRAAQENLQDVLPPSIHPDTGYPYKAGKPPKRWPKMPAKLLKVWREWEQSRRLMLLALGVPEHLFDLCIGTDSKSFSSDLRDAFNEHHAVEDILERNGYRRHGDRWQHEGSQSSAGIREMHGVQGWMVSHNYGDPLYGSFDAWTAFVVLEHGGDVKVAEVAFRGDEPEHARTLQEVLTAKKRRPAKPEPRRKARRRKGTSDPTPEPEPAGEAPAQPEQAEPEPAAEGEEAVPEEAFGFDGNDLIDRSVAPIHWRVQDLITSGAHLLVGRPKGGKSWLTMDLAFACSNGGLFMDRPCERSGVLWIAAEDTRDSLARRMQLRGERFQSFVQVHTMDSLPALRAACGFEHFHEWLDAHLGELPEIGVVIIDTQATVDAVWSDEQIDVKRNASVVEQAYQKSRLYDRIGAERGVAIVLVHHSRKRNGQNVSDYHELINLPQTVVAGATASFVLADLPDSDPHEEDTMQRIFAFRGRHLSKDTAPVQIKIENARVNVMGVYADVAQTNRQQQVLTAIEALLKHSDSVSMSEIASALGVHKNAVQRCLQRATERSNGELVWKGRKLLIRPGVGVSWVK